MAQDFGSKLQEILKKLEKLYVIESSLLNIQRQLGNLERRTQELEAFQSTTKKDIVDLKDGLSFIGDQATDGECQCARDRERSYCRALDES